jgi:large subunit ribosomal protein L7/L12
MSTQVNIEKVAEQLVGLTVKEVTELGKILKEKHGIEPAAAPTVAMAPAPVAAAVEEEKTHFDVVLKEVGGAKLKVIKAVKELTGLGLKESKDLVEAAPKPIKENVAKAEAEKMKDQLEDAGAKAELK